MHQPHEENVEKLLIALLRFGERIMSAFDDLTAAVNANTDAVNAAILAGIGTGTGGTPDSSLEPLTAQLQKNNDALKAAMPPASGTPPATTTPAFTPSFAAARPAVTAQVPTFKPSIGK